MSNTTTGAEGRALGRREESPQALANAVPQDGPISGSTPRPEGEGALGHAAAGGRPSAPVALVEDSDKAIKVVRATSRIELDRRNIPPPIFKELQKQLYQTQRLVARGMNACIRELWRLDGETLDAYMVEHGCPPKKVKDWPYANPNLYQLVRAVSPELSGAIASLAARMAFQRWRQDRYKALVLSEGIPHFRQSDAIPVRAAEVRLTKTEARSTYMLSFALVSGRGQRFEIPIKARDRHQGEVLQAIASGTYKHGNLLVERKKRRGHDRWYARLQYTRLVPKASAGKKAAINRGMRVFLAGVIDDGDRWLYDGHDIIAYLKQIQARRRQYQHSSKAAGRSGRGRKRMLKPIEKLQGKGRRWRATKNQTVARRFVKWLSDRKVSTLYVEDFSGIRESYIGNDHIQKLIHEWPYFDLGRRIESCCEEAGIHVVKVDAEYISQRCPKCGEIDEENRDLQKWRLQCVHCGYREHLDSAAARNVLYRGRDQSDGDDGGGAPSSPATGRRSRRASAARKRTRKRT